MEGEGSFQELRGHASMREGIDMQPVGRVEAWGEQGEGAQEGARDRMAGGMQRSGNDADASRRKTTGEGKNDRGMPGGMESAARTIGRDDLLFWVQVCPRPRCNTEDFRTHSAAQHLCRVPCLILCFCRKCFSLKSLLQ